MSGKVKGILAVIVLMGIGLGARWMIYDDSAVQESSLSEEEAEKKKKINAVYNTENQAEIKEDLGRLKQEQTYTQDNMLIIRLEPIHSLCMCTLRLRIQRRYRIRFMWRIVQSKISKEHAIRSRRCRHSMNFK